jgi:hypothetical protein
MRQSLPGRYTFRSSTYAQCDRNTGLPPHSKVMVGVSTRDHLSMHITAEAQLNTDIVLFDSLSKLFFDMYNVTYSVGLP